MAGTGAGARSPDPTRLSEGNDEAMKPSFAIRQEAERFALVIALLLVLLTAVLTYRAWAAFERNRAEAANHPAGRGRNHCACSHLSKTPKRGSGDFFSPERIVTWSHTGKRSRKYPPAWMLSLASEAGRHHPDQLQRIDRLRPLVQDKDG